MRKPITNLGQDIQGKGLESTCKHKLTYMLLKDRCRELRDSRSPKLGRKLINLKDVISSHELVNLM